MAKFFISDKVAGSQERAKETAISMIGDGKKTIGDVRKNPKMRDAPRRVVRNKFKKGYDVTLSRGRYDRLGKVRL